MVRYLIKKGRKIKLLPPPDSLEEEEMRCSICGTKFDSGSHRRTCWDICGHVRCITCIFKLTDGCDQCLSENLLLKPVKGEGNGEDVEAQVQKVKRPQVLILDAVLTKCSSEEDDFPEIKTLSLSALPVLECATEPPEYFEDEEEEGNLDEEQVVPVKQDIPLIDLAAEEENIPVIDLSDDDDEDPKNLKMTADELCQTSLDQMRCSEDMNSNVKSQDSHSKHIDSQVKLGFLEGGTVDSNLRSQNSTKTSERSCQFTMKLTPPPESPSRYPDDHVVNVLEEEPKSPYQLSDTLSNSSKENDNDTSRHIGSQRFLRQRRISPNYRTFLGASGAREFGSHICRYCNMAFIDKQSLGLHISQEHWDARPYPCHICAWPFISKRSLQNHLLSHSDERPFKCTDCDSTFNKPYTLKLHMAKIHGVVPENRKKKAKKRKSPNIVSKNTEISKPIENEFKPMPLPIPIEIFENDHSDVQSRSQNELEQNGIIIQHCDLPPKKRLYIRGNPNSHRRDPQNETVTSKYSCCHCKQSFTRKSKLGNHLREAHADVRPYACDLCGWSFSQKNKLNLHRITHTIDRPHKCKQCESTFNRKYSLERHIRIMHLKKPRRSEAAENKPNQKKPASCPYCNEEFENRAILCGHLQASHGEKRPHVCNQCQWPFSRKKHLIAHMRTHNPDRPFQCTMCDNKFNRRFSLERHMDHVHGVRIRLTPQETPQGEEYCPECQSLFESEKCVKVAYSKCGHISCLDCVKMTEELGCGQCTTETAPKTIVEESGSPVPEKSCVNNEPCRLQPEKLNFSTCGENLEKISSGANCKSNNMAAPEEKKKSKYRCSYCDKDYSEKADLGIHYRSEHSDVRPHPCEVCGWPFSSFKDLERHQVIHTNEKPYSCHMCSMSFNRKSTRDRHVEKVHLKWRRI